MNILNEGFGNKESELDSLYRDVKCYILIAINID